MSNQDKNADLPENESDLESIVEAVSNDESNDENAAEGEPPTVDDLLEEVQELRAKNNDLIDQFTRAKAETDNTRRISIKEVEKARKFGLETFAKELLPVKDSLDQAAQVDLQSNASEALIEQMADGLGLTLKQFETVFERFKVEVVDPEAGDKIDPELHQAMTKQPSDEVDENNIITTIQVGYTLNERLLRPAMVIVSSGPA